MSERNDDRQTALELERQHRPPRVPARRARTPFPWATVTRVIAIIVIAFVLWRTFR